MSRKNSSRAALRSSILAIVMSGALLIGTTFAWFTDTATLNIETIQSGSLAVDLVDANGQSLADKTLQWITDDATPIWEPGATYELPEIYVKNSGNLALAYVLEISGVDGDAKLLEAIDFSYNGLDLEQRYTLLAGEQSAAIKITATMREDAGNEYQDLSISGISLTAKATQHTHEKDSTDDQYDKDAIDDLLYDAYIDNLREQGYVQHTAANISEAKDKVVLTEPVTVDGGSDLRITNSAEINFAGHPVTRATASGNGLLLGENTGSSVELDLVLENAKFHSVAGSNVIRVENNTNVTVRDSSFTTDAAGSTGLGGFHFSSNVGGEVTIRFENTVFNKQIINIAPFNNITKVNLEFVNCTFNWDDKNFSNFVSYNAYAYGNLSFDNCEFNLTNFHGNNVIYMQTNTSTASPHIVDGVLTTVKFNDVKIKLDAALTVAKEQSIKIIGAGIALKDLIKVESTGDNSFTYNGTVLDWDAIVKK